MSCLTRKGNEVNLSEYLEKVLLSEKIIHVFAASGSSSIGKTVKKPEPYVKGGTIADAVRVTSVSDIL